MVPGVKDVPLRGASAWIEDFEQDGLNPDRTRLIRHAADGLVEARGIDPGLDSATAERERAIILRLTLNNDPLPNN